MHSDWCLDNTNYMKQITFLQYELCDGGEKAYGAVIFLRWELRNGSSDLNIPELFVPMNVSLRSDNGFQLLVCSWDGTVAYADFTPEELGRAMSEDEKVVESTSAFHSSNLALLLFSSIVWFH